MRNKLYKYVINYIYIFTLQIRLLNQQYSKKTDI